MQAGDVERHRHPARVNLEQEPEQQQEDRHPALNDRQRPPARQARHQPRVAGHQDADDEPGGEHHVGEVVRTELGDELANGSAA